MSNEYNGKKRSELPDSVFGIPQERKYPMPDEKHTRSAIKLFNHVEPKYEEQLAKAIIKNMKKYNIDGSVVGPNNRLRKYLPKDMIKESSINEGFVKSDKDIYYNKDKFDSGEINLCFITGLSGSGKSTMGRNMSSKNTEHYEMDDVICNDNFSDDNLKEYGGLISSFFKGPGKSFRLIRNDDKHNDSVFNTHKNYEKEITQAFVKHAISYCKSHKETKYVCDGIWIFMFIKPEQLKDCAVYIKGISSIKSAYRALKRDIDENKRNGMTSLQIFRYEFKRIKEDVLYARENQKELRSFRSYFEKQSTNESLVRLRNNRIYDIGSLFQRLDESPESILNEKGNYDHPYDRPYTAEEIKQKYGNKVYRKLSKDPAHKYRMDSGIELIHKEPTKEELERIWYNWNLMDDDQKSKSDKKSIELFGKTNKDHYDELISSYTNEASNLPQNTGISTIIFDIGDVLVSTNIKDYLRADPDVPNEIIDELLKLWFLEKDEIDDTMDLDTYREIVNKRMGTEFSKYIPNLFKANIDCVDVFDYTIPMIQDLKDKGYKVYFLSNWSAWTHDLLIREGKFDFLSTMDGGVFSFSVGYMKPDEEIYKILLNRYKIDPEKAIFFDDKEENIEAAKKLGIKGVVFDRHDSALVYTSLLVNEIYILGINHSFLPDFIREYVSDENPIIEFNLGKRINEDTAGREIVSRIRDKVLTSENYKEASKLDLSLKCTVENIDSNIVWVLILDGDQSNRDTMEAKNLLSKIRLDISPLVSDIVSKISIGDGDEGCLYFTLDKKKILKNKPDLLQEYGTTGGTIVGTNQPDSVYIVNYMQNNVFSGHKEKKRAICKKGMNQMYTTQDGHTVPVDIDDFKENASEITVFKLKEEPLIPYDTIIELANFDNEFYTLLTGDIALDVDSILAIDSRFVQEENFFDELDAIKACTESTILSESETTKYPYIKVLTESEYGRPWNYYRDINGIFAMNEITGLRTKSYEDISGIPKPELDLVKRGTVYGVTE